MWPDHLESPMVLDPFNVSNVRDGVIPSDFVGLNLVKLHPEGSGIGTSLPNDGHATRGSSSQQPVSSIIDMQVSRVVQKYHNPDPLLRLIGLANGATIIVEGQQILALIDSGAQLSTMSELLVQALKLPIHKLNNLIEAEVSGVGYHSLYWVC